MYGLKLAKIFVLQVYICEKKTKPKWDWKFFTGMFNKQIFVNGIPILFGLT